MRRGAWLHRFLSSLTPVAEKRCARIEALDNETVSEAKVHWKLLKEATNSEREA